MYKIAITGAGGKMGRILVATVNETSETNLTLAIEHKESDYIAQDVGILAGINNLNLKIQNNFHKNFDVLIDFTRPHVSLANLEFCKKNHKKIIIGTTGFTDGEKQIITKAAQQIPIVFAPNMSVGVNLCYQLLAMAAKTIGANSDIEIIEAHHRHKVDAPSGTALAMGEVIAKTLGRDLRQDGVFARDGIMPPRSINQIGFSTVRAGDIVGEHTVMFADIGERIEITHKASSRVTFAKGAVRAAIWLAGQNAGLYNMADVLGFND